MRADGGVALRAWRAVSRLAAFPSRHALGQDLASRGAVVALDLRRGVVEASVRDDDGDTCRVRLSVRVTGLPDPDQVEWACSCGDALRPCAHGVAAWLAAGERLSARPELLSVLLGTAALRPSALTDAPTEVPQVTTSAFWGEGGVGLDPPPPPLRPPGTVPWVFERLGPPPVGRGRMPGRFASDLTAVYARMAELARRELRGEGGADPAASGETAER